MTVRAPFGNALRVLATLVVLTAAVSAQVTDHATVQQLGPDSNWTGTEPVAPHDLRWDERLPESRPEPTAGDIRGDLPRSRMADLADLEGIFSYRFVGEHFSSFAGNSISFSDDTDCDGFSEVLIGAPWFGGQGFSGGPGAAYVVSVADVEAADAADGIVDRVIDLGFVAALPRSWKLVGAGRQGVGTAVASDGDANGDGCSDLLIGAPDRYSTGSAYVVSALDLPAADAADGEADGVVDIRRIADQPDSWEIADGDRGDSAGTQVAFVRDMNGDGRSDLLIGAPAFNAQNQPGAAYVLSGAALPSADAEDGVADGRIALASVAAQPDSWKLVGENAGDRVGRQLSAANLDSDGRSDFIVDASIHTAGLDQQGAVYLIAASDLPAMDNADGDLDGLIELRNAAGGNASWKLLGSARNQAIGSTHLGARAVVTGDVVGDGRDEVVIATQAWTDAPDAGVFVVSVPDLPSADEADGAEDGVVRLDHALAQEDSFSLEWEGPRFNVSSNVDVDGDGLVDILVGSYDYRDVGCLPSGGYGTHGGVALVPGGSLHAADAADGEADTVVDLEGMSSADGFWKFIGGPTDRLGTSVSAGDIDGDGKDDPILASMIHHIPYRACGSIVSTGFVFVMSSAHFQAADALDGETDGEIRVDTLHVDVEPAPPVVREITQFEDSVVVMRVSGSLKTAELDFDALADGFYAHYEDEFDYLVFISNLPTLNYSQRHQYYGIHMDVSNTVRGTGRRIYDSGGTLKSMIHFPYRDPILYGPSLHEIMHSWANYAIPTVEPVHWGFSSANGQLGGFDLANLVDLGNGRYSAGRFGTFANGGNSLPYSPMELYFAGLIPPEEVPDLWVAKDGEWAGERDESGNSIFTASDVETWSVRRVVEEHGVRAPDWRSSQKSFRAAVVLITDDGFPATSATLRELREALRTFSHPGSDGNDGSFNFWEATGGRAAIKMDDLQGSGVPVVTNQPPAPAGVLAPLTIALGRGGGDGGRIGSVP